MPDREFLRQQDLLTPEDLRGADVDIVGGGSLGGAILLCLCKMGCGLANRVTITDHDLCEPHNLPTQWFRTSHTILGRSKVEALADTVGFLCERQITTRRDRFSGAERRRVGPVVILAVDSIEERSRIWKGLARRDDVQLLIDARMGAEVLEIRAFVFGQDDPESYSGTLHSPEESFREPCTRRAIMYTPFGAAAFVGSLFRSWAASSPFPRYLAFDFGNFMMEAGEPVPCAAQA